MNLQYNYFNQRVDFIMVKNVDKLEDKIGIKFNTKNLLIEALSHSTYLEENPDFKIKFGLVDGHNQRLEYFGDSILGNIIAEKLYKSYPGREGNLTEIKKYFVNGDKLEEISNNIGLEKFLNMGIGESENESGHEKRIRDALEALIAAIYLDQEDQGYEKAKEFVDKFFLYNLDYVLENFENLIPENDPISHLQRIVQAYGFAVPAYEITRIGGPDHAPIFRYEVYVSGQKIGDAEGFKKEVKKNAAINAITVFNSDFLKNQLS